MKRCIAAVFAVMLFALAGCAEKAAAKEYGKDSTDIAVNSGKTFVIRLEENPTTGYSWKYAIADPAIAANVEDRYVASDASGKLVGSGGTRILTFEGKKAGTTTITLKYLRSWEPNSPASTIVYHVTVN